MTDAILVLNAGSSSIKFTVYDRNTLADDRPGLMRGQISGIGRAATLSVAGDDGSAPQDATDLPADGEHRALTEWLLAWLREALPGLSVIAAGHRVVHGGVNHAAPVLIDPETLDDLARLIPLAPQHQPHNLAAIEAVGRTWPDIPQVACFDTAFHRSQPELAQLFALPRRLLDQGIRRYGFHGLSYEYIADTLPEHTGGTMPARVVVAHLGHGASMCAMADGRSVATTMGFTALDGLPMATRCGSVDPGVLLHLLDSEKLSAEALARVLYDDSGLLGLSGISDDVRELTASDDPRARQTLDYFAYRVARELGSLAATLGGLDALVFTAGIGENAANIRAAVGARAGWLGVRLSPEANERHGPRISADDSAVSAWVIPTNEEVMIGRHTLRLVGRSELAGAD